MLGPVMIMTRSSAFSSVSLGTKRSRPMDSSTTGWRPFFMT